MLWAVREAGWTAVTASAFRDASGTLEPGAYRTAADQLVASYDTAHGGFGRAPKFPTPNNLQFLMGLYRTFVPPSVSMMSQYSSVMQTSQAALFELKSNMFRGHP